MTKTTFQFKTCSDKRRNNAAYKMTNYDCVNFQFKKIQPVEKTTFRFKAFSARRNNVAKILCKYV